MELENALEWAGKLRDVIAVEIEDARRERNLIRTLDGSGLFDRAAKRAAFLDEIAKLEKAVRSALARVGSSLGMEEVTLDALRARGPGPGSALADTLSEARALASALHEMDAVHLELARRSLAVVGAYVDAMRPAPRAYDRRGLRASAPVLAVVSSKG